MSSIATVESFIYELKKIIGRIKWNSHENENFFYEQTQKVVQLFDGKKTVDDILQNHVISIFRDVLIQNELLPSYVTTEFSKFVEEQSQYELINTRCEDFFEMSQNMYFSSVEQFIMAAGLHQIAKPEILDIFTSRIKKALIQEVSDESSCDSS